MRSFVLALTLLICGATFAMKVDGLIIRTSDTLHVLLVVPTNTGNGQPDYRKIQRSIKYIGASGKKQELLPSDAKEIQFAWGSRTIRMISCPGDHKFLKLEKEGPLMCLVYYYSVQYTSTTMVPMGQPPSAVQMEYQEFVLMKDDKVTYNVQSEIFKYQLLKYFEDCPLLKEKIKNDEYTFVQVPTMVEFYNLYCAPDVQPSH